MPKLKSYSPIIIISGQSKSIFFEIFFKSIKLKSFKSPIILISSKKLLTQNMKKFNFKKKIKLLELENLNKIKLDNKYINLIEVDKKKIVDLNSNKFIENSFFIAFKILKSGITNKFINGPINKSFLKKKYLGITEYISEYFSIKNHAMLIYNKKLSVCPVTTHLPLKFVIKNISKKLIKKKIKIIHDFYLNKLKFKPRIAILGLNPHCETIDKYSEEEKIIKPTIKFLNKKGFNLDGPFSTDTFFLKKNLDKYDVVLGMYHDQVITPLKTLFNFNAINITVGLPFIRISPDHGPNSEMLGKNKSDPSSFIYAMKFAEKLK